MNPEVIHHYYDVFNDLRDYPEAVVVVAYSRRGVGKTYGALYGAYQKKLPIVYVKRTKEDIDLICEDSEEFETSPYVPINRDHGTNIHPKKIQKGIAGFYDMDSEDKKPIAYAVALSAVKAVKGMDMSRAEFLIFDEFIPQASESRVLHTEGSSVLDLAETIGRDRIKRGRGPLKILLFANAEDIYCPVIDELQIMDDLAALAMSGQSIRYVEDRLILIHHVNEIELEEAEKSGGLYRVMKGTSWWRKSYGGEFSKVDFTNVSKQALKKYSCVMKIHYREDDYYLYRKDREFYFCKTPSNRYIEDINLNRDNDIRRFYSRYCIDLQEACNEGLMRFSDYSLYDMVANYSKRFKNVL